MRLRRIVRWERPPEAIAIVSGTAVDMSGKPGLPTLFLSYAHEDQVEAEQLAAALQRTGYTVWWDALIEGGVRYARTIGEALAAADVVIVLWSRQSVQSDWVCDEAAQGRDRHRLVPVTLDTTPPPLGFRQIQTIDLSKWNGRANAPQFNSVRRAIATALGQEVPPLPAIAGAEISRRKLVIAGSSVAVVAGGAVVAWETGLVGPGKANAKSIAVLPFKNLSGDATQSYLSDGLTEEIRSALARNDGLMVLAGTSSKAAADMAGSAKSIAAKLDVSYLLEGSVRRAGELVRVAINLTNGRTGFNEWSQRVDRRLEDIFAFESEIARTVATALSVKVATDTPMPGGTRNVRAYEAYLRGKELFYLAKSEDTDRKSRANFEVAVSADPKFALAHAFLSRILAILADQHTEAAEVKRLYDRAIAEARQAVAISPNLAEGHLALAKVLFSKLDVRGAQPSFDKAYRYGRGDAEVVHLYALYTVRMRRFRDARDAIERALALDPLNPQTHSAAGKIAHASRRYADSISQYRRALQLNPDMSTMHGFIGDSLVQLNRFDEARTAYAAENAPMLRLRGQAILEHRAGNREAAKKAFDQLVREIGDAATYQQAEVMAQWGRPDEAFALLRRASTIGDSGLIYLATDPFLDPIAQDPRFGQLIRDIGFA